MRGKTLCVGIALLTVFVAIPESQAQRMTYPPEEFAARRQSLCDEVGNQDLIMMVGKTMTQPGVRFRQDNDFYYLTGVEDLNAVLAIDAANCEASLFLPAQTEREASRDGWNLLYQEGAAAAHGLASIHPLTYLQEYFSRKRNATTQTLYVRLAETTEVDQSRGDTAIFIARRMANPWGSYPSEDAWRVEKLRATFPYYELKDISPHVDMLRMIKSPREIETLEGNGWVSAEVGGWEYEIEAEATYVMLKHGAEGAGYPAIVGSGPNSNAWHYNKSSRQLQDGDIIVMDYGASMGYLTIDITRTWPANGKFTELQERAYRCVLEAEKAIIAAMKPGVTRQETREIAAAIYEKWGFENQYPGGAGHFVGMSVHDVGDYSLPLQAGMVIAVEPIIDIPEEELHVRIEDTVLITETGHVVLSSHVPKEVEEILALVGKRAKDGGTER